MSFEEEYEDVLQNIEFGIISVYRQDRALLDYDVMDAVDGLIRYYAAEQSGRTAPTLRLAERPQRVFDATKSMCELRLGRQSLTNADPDASSEKPQKGLLSRLLKNESGFFGVRKSQQNPDIEPLSVEEIVKCLKRIQTSIRRWNKQGGRQGYLNFASEFIR